MGSSLGKNFLTKVWFTTETMRDVAVSWSVKPRPRTIDWPTVSKKCGLTRSHDAPIIRFRTGRRTALDKHAFAPVIALQRAVQRHAHALHAGKSGEFALQSFVGGADGGGGVARAGGIEVEDVAVGGGDAEILMLEGCADSA